MDEKITKDLYLFIGRTDENLKTIKGDVSEHKKQLEEVGKKQIAHDVEIEKHNTRITNIEKKQIDWKRVSAILFSPKKGLIPLIIGSGSLTAGLLMYFGG